MSVGGEARCAGCGGGGPRKEKKQAGPSAGKSWAGPGFAGPRGMKGKEVGWAGLGWAESSKLGLFWTGLQGFG